MYVAAPSLVYSMPPSPTSSRTPGRGPPAARAREHAQAALDERPRQPDGPAPRVDVGAGLDEQRRSGWVCCTPHPPRQEADRLLVDELLVRPGEILQPRSGHVSRSSLRVRDRRRRRLSRASRSPPPAATTPYCSHRRQGPATCPPALQDPAARSLGPVEPGVRASPRDGPRRDRLLLERAQQQPADPPAAGSAVDRHPADDAHVAPAAQGDRADQAPAVEGAPAPPDLPSSSPRSTRARRQRPERWLPVRRASNVDGCRRSLRPRAPAGTRAHPGRSRAARKRATTRRRGRYVVLQWRDLMGAQQLVRLLGCFGHQPRRRLASNGPRRNTRGSHSSPARDRSRVERLPRKCPPMPTLTMSSRSVRSSRRSGR